VNFLFNINIDFYILAYLVGGIPFGLLLAEYFGKIDITKTGSGSIGATNVLRVLKSENPKLAKKVAIATLALDVSKGIVILGVAKLLGLSVETLWTIAILSVIGHCYSPYLRFEGGKGVATGMGVSFFMLPLSTIIGVVVWLISAKTIKISSISSLLGFGALVIASFILHPDIDVIKTHAPILIIAFIILYKHIPNIVRLFRGKERQIV